MNLKPVLVLSLMFVLAPVWIGTIWTGALRIRGRASRVLHAWVFGFATMLAAGQLVFVPMVALGRKLSEAQAVWEFCMELLAAAAFVLFLVKRGGQLFAGEKDSAAGTDLKKNAAADKKDAAVRKAEYEEKIKNVDKEAEEILSEARKKALNNEARIVEEAREEAARIIQRANEEAELEKKRVLDEMKQEMISIASMMAGKVVAASIDTTIQDTLVEETLKEIGDSTWQS